MLVLLSGLLIAFVLAAGALLVLSPGKPGQLRDEAGNPLPGRLSEKVFVEINGVRQGMFIQSTDGFNPVLLFLHGGPGMPEFFLNASHPSGLERIFTVVWWEQRGAGLSFSSAIPAETMTVDQLIADTITVADYLRQRFGQNKIYLLGHSWGSFLGIQAAAAAPELFHAYIGMGQVAHQLASEVAAHGYMLEAYRQRGDTGMVRKLEAAPVSMSQGLSSQYMRQRDEAMHGLGVGTTRDMRSVITGIFLPVWKSPAYTLGEKIDIWRGKAFSRRFLWEEFLRTDLTSRIHRLEIPVYFLIGRHDYTAHQELSRAYFERLGAPFKRLYVFENSAHSPLFEEPQRARQILLDDVLGVAQSSDHGGGETAER